MRRDFFLQRFAATTVISGTSGNDNIDAGEIEKAIINAGDGNDRIYNYDDSASISGGTGNDSIYSDGYHASINGGAGNDRITLAAVSNLVQYASGDGNDTIWGFNETDTLTITGGSYSTQTSGDNVIVTVGKGSILLVGAKDKTLNINSEESTEVLTLTKGADTLSNNLDKVTINARDGNDSITNSYGYRVLINAGDGNNSITSSGSRATILSGKGDDSITNEGGYASINAGEGNDSISNNYRYNVTINAGTGNDYIYNYNGNNVSINAGAGNDSIVNNYGSYASINAGSGDDSISNSSYMTAIISGAGNDSITNTGNKVSIYAGSGNDIITTAGYKTSIRGGTGNDHISLTSVSNLIQYKSGDGNDTIYGFNESDTLTITGGKYSTQASGDDVIVTVGKGSILLVGANDKNLNINKKKSTEVITLTKVADTLSNLLDNVTINAGKGNDSIYSNAVKVTLIFITPIAAMT